MRDHIIGRFVEQQRRGHPCRRGRGLDAEAALAGEPEEIGAAGGVAVDREAIGGEGSEAGPAVLDAMEIFEESEASIDVQTDLE